MSTETKEQRIERIAEKHTPASYGGFEPSAVKEMLVLALTALCEEMEREKDHIGVDLDKAFREARELQYVPCPSASSKAGKTKVLGTEFNVWVTFNDPEEDL